MRTLFALTFLCLTLACSAAIPPLEHNPCTTNTLGLGVTGQILSKTVLGIDWINVTASGALDSNWWWAAYGSKTLTNANDFQPASAVLSNAAATGVLTNANAFQPANAHLTNLANLADGTGVLTDNGLGGLTWNLSPSLDQPNFTNAFRKSTSSTFDTNEYVTADYVKGLLTREVQFYFRASITNTATNGCWLLSDTYNPTNTTNTAFGVTNGLYAASFISTNQLITALVDGIATVDFDAEVTTGTAVVRPEFYILTNGTALFEADSGNQVSITTTRAHITTSLAITTNITVPTGAFLAVKFKVISQTGGAGKFFEVYTGSNAVSGITLPGVPFVQPLTSTFYLLSTNQTYVSLTNHFADFNQQYSDLFATNDLNFTHTTNRLAGFWKTTVIKIYAGPTNRQIWLNSLWTGIGSAYTNYVLLVTNKVAILSLGQDGDQETNVTAILVAQP